MNDTVETEVFDEIQEPALENEVIENEEVENEVDPAENESAEDSEQEKPQQSRSQNAKQRLRRKVREQERLNAELHERMVVDKARIDALESKLEGVINPPAERPTRINFETEEEYEDALYDYRASSSARKQDNIVEPSSDANQKEVSRAVQQDARVISNEVMENWEDQLDIASEKYPDFKDVMVSIKPEHVTDIMANTIFESDNGGDITYFLGKNPKEAARISALSPISQLREIDKLETKFSKSLTNAPSPINPILGKGDVMSESTDPLLKGATFE